MTRKHFIEIAKIVSNQPDTAREALALDFVRMFQKNSVERIEPVSGHEIGTDSTSKIAKRDP